MRYRRPDLADGEVDAALESVDLATRVAALPEGQRTTLRRGGEPLTRQEIARLWIARATMGKPDLLLLERIDDDLGAEGREMLRRVLADYPGVVLAASDRPEAILEGWRVWGPTQSDSAPNLIASATA